MSVEVTGGVSGRVSGGVSGRVAGGVSGRVSGEVPGRVNDWVAAEVIRPWKCQLSMLGLAALNSRRSTWSCG